jgi:hypothetical protein
MNAFIDDFLVGLVLFAGFGYATYSLGPKSLRGYLIKALAALLRRLPAGVGLGVAERLAARNPGACGGCDNCGSNMSSNGKSAAGQSVAAEVSVPVAKIGKRQ